MKRFGLRFFLAFAFISGVSGLTAVASIPDWSEGARISESARANPYQIPSEQLPRTLRQGKLHALEYPVEVTGILMPHRPFKSFIEDRHPSPFRFLLQKTFKGFTQIQSTDDIFRQIGLHTYPRTQAEGRDEIPYQGDTPPAHRMGVTLIPRNGVPSFTISCAACHSANLFGKRVLGMTNRFPRSNEFFLQGKLAASLAEPRLFAAVTGATPDETEIYAGLREATRFVGVKKPQTLGLDTSLAQVALSLARRNRDDYATRNALLAQFPREERLATRAADSKPAVWWNLKYKNRWLSDGSVVSGNPIFTNIIWNEIGRGTDLKELETWLNENPTLITELTTAVFSTEAPRFTDFFPASRLDPAKVRLGQNLFEQACAKCHGHYDKAWDLPHAPRLPWAEQLKTVRVRYPEQTKVIDVHTDPARYQGMTSLAAGLNPLSISRTNGVVIKPQKGYVPPPLVGIWARWPYFHNNSVPSLCALLTPAPQRPVSYYSGEAMDPERDFDLECNGYPVGSAVPDAWKRDPDHFYDTRREGMGNGGHDEKIFVKDGVEIFTQDEKLALIRFLQTL